MEGKAYRYQLTPTGDYLSEPDAEVVQQIFLQPKKLQLCRRTW